MFPLCVYILCDFNVCALYDVSKCIVCVVVCGFIILSDYMLVYLGISSFKRK